MINLGVAALLLAPAGASAELLVASVDFTTREVSPQLGTAYAERFALFLRAQKISVTTSKDLATMLSLERQRQLVGCADQSKSCLTELAGALGADALITGQLGRLGKSFQINVKIVKASNATTVFQLSKTAMTEEDVLEALEEAAPVAAARLREAFPAAPSVEPSAPAPAAPGVVTRAQPVGPWVLTASGAAVTGAGAALLVASVVTAPPLDQPSSEVPPSAVPVLTKQAEQLRLGGAITAGVGAAMVVGSLVWLRLANADAPAVSLWCDGRSAALVVGGRW